MTELDENTCDTEDCGNSLNDGEGWNGKCGDCADRIEAEREAREAAEEETKAEAKLLRNASTALRAALGILDPHESEEWSHAWRTADDLDDCAARITSPVVPAPTITRERCHDCSCHISPPCGRCVECKHVDYPECENDCQDCEDHQEPEPAPAPVHTTTCTDQMVRGYPGTVARCTCGWSDAWGIPDGSAEASAYEHSKTHEVKA